MPYSNISELPARIKPIESGMNKATDNEKSKKKIKSGFPKYNF
jgi:hypothetical protein